MILQQIVNGLVLGATYSLIALGFTLIIGVLEMLNLAVGEILMVSGFVGLIALVVFGAPFPIALVLAMLMGAAASLVVYFLSFKMVDTEFFAAPVLSTIGIGIMLTSGATRVFGSENQAYPDVVANQVLHAGPVGISLPQILILAVAVTIMVALHLLVNRTRLGLAIRAVSERPGTSALLGVPVERIVIITFLISGAIVGAAGVLTSMAFHTINPFVGFDATLKGLAIMVLGGLGNVRGAMIAGLFIGVVEVLSVVLVSATFRNALAFAILIVVLLLRPQGLLGTRTHEASV